LLKVTRTVCQLYFAYPGREQDEHYI